MARIPYDPYDQDFEDKAAGPGSWGQPFGSFHNSRLDAAPEKPKSAADVVYGNMDSPDYRGRPQRSESFFASADNERQESWVDDFFPSMRKQQPSRPEPAPPSGDRMSADTDRVAPNQYASLKPPAVPKEVSIPQSAALTAAQTASAQAPKTLASQPAASPDKLLLARDRASILSSDFLAAISQKEAPKGENENQKAWETRANEAKHPSGALGKYQLTKIALKDIGYRDEEGNWTEKAISRGIRSEQDFKAKPDQQDVAMQEYLHNQEGYLAEARRHLGQEIDGIKAKFPITEGGLMAAAHRQGATAVLDYLAHQERNGWKSDFTKISEKKDAVFRAVETRLREFAENPYRKWLGD